MKNNNKQIITMKHKLQELGSGMYIPKSLPSFKSKKESLRQWKEKAEHMNITESQLNKINALYNQFSKVGDTDIANQERLSKAFNRSFNLTPEGEITNKTSRKLFISNHKGIANAKIIRDKVINDVGNSSSFNDISLNWEGISNQMRYYDFNNIYAVLQSAGPDSTEQWTDDFLKSAGFGDSGMSTGEAMNLLYAMEDSEFRAMYDFVFTNLSGFGYDEVALNNKQELADIRSDLIDKVENGEVQDEATARMIITNLQSILNRLG